MFRFFTVGNSSTLCSFIVMVHCSHTIVVLNCQLAHGVCALPSSIVYVTFVRSVHDDFNI